jgi:hypothetical protein
VDEQPVRLVSVWTRADQSLVAEAGDIFVPRSYKPAQSKEPDDGYDGSGVWFDRAKEKARALSIGSKAQLVPNPNDGPEDPPPAPEPEDKPQIVHRMIYATATTLADMKNDVIIVKYELKPRGRGGEDFPRFSFEPIVGDFVVSDTGDEYQIVKRRFGWTGKPHKSQVALTVWLNRCKSIGPEDE